MAAASPTYHEVAKQIATRMDDAFTAGTGRMRASDFAQDVALGLRLGAHSRFAGVAVCTDTASAGATAYDALRAMCEIAAQLAWLAERPDVVNLRASCIRLGQARADVQNRRKVVRAHERHPQRLADSDFDMGTMRQRLKDSEEALQRVEAAHAQPCGQCSGSGRNASHVKQWLDQRVDAPDATVADLNLFATWVACSADAHSLVPQRFAQADGNYLELPKEMRRYAFGLAVGLLFLCELLAVSTVRPEGGRDDIEAAIRACHELLRHDFEASTPE